MNGTIARVNCKVGDTVKADAAVIILEAMKMENEIYAGVDGTVKAVQVNTGDAVQPGDVARRDRLRRSHRFEVR